MASKRTFVGVWTAPRHNSSTTDPLDNYNSGSIRPVLFVLYTLESICNIFCLVYHISGFHAIKLDMFDWEEQFIHYIYLIVFYVFMVTTLFQSINLCTGYNPTVTRELIKTSSATVGFFFVSLATMWDAERQFYKFADEPKIENRPDKFINFEPVHPVFLYMRSQSISALGCGALYLLHTCLMIDYKLTTESEDSAYMPMAMFVFGRWVHTKLENYEWFRDFASYDRINV